MKYCLCLKYNQSEIFRNTLAETGDLLPVEDATFTDYSSNIFWGAKMVKIDNQYYYWGCNIVGKLLMSLKNNNGKLSYSLPDDFMLFNESII